MTNPTFDFSHLSISERVARFTLYQVAGEPYLDMVHAGESNKPYFNALLKRSRKNVRRMRAGAMDANTMAQNRDEDRTLYPRYVIKGWGCKKGPGIILDSKANEISYSEENLRTFLNALPNWLFDDVRLFASEEANFVDEQEGEEIPNPEVVSGN